MPPSTFITQQVGITKSREGKSSPRSTPQHDRRWHRGHTFRLWWLEAACCCLVVGAFVAIVITVRTLEHQILPKLPYHLSINSLIAVFTTTMKAAAGLTLAEGISHLKWTTLAKPRSLQNFEYHDQASRGPLGALKLIGSNSFRDQRVSSLGALVTILLLLLDPFSQQIVHFYSCTRERENVVATMSRAQYFIIGTPFRSSMVRTVGFSVFGGASPIPSFSCPTGNCTFDKEYHSLATCSTCENITKNLVFTNYTAKDSYGLDLPKVNITLPGELKKLANITWSRATIPAMEDDNGRMYSSYDGVLFAQTGDGSTAIIRRSEDIENPKYWAYSCQIYPCLKAYTASVTGGILREDLKHQTGPNDELFGKGNLQVGDYRDYDLGVAVEFRLEFWSLLDLKCLNSTQQGRLKDLGYTWNATTRWMPYKREIEKATANDPFLLAGNGTHMATLSDEDDKGIATSCMYTIDWWSFNRIGDWMDKRLSGIVDRSYADDDFLYALYTSGSGNGTLDDASLFFRKIADSYTTHLRQTGTGLYANITPPAQGTVYYNTTCVQVQWQWLLYAGATTILFLIFFVGTIIQTRRDQSKLLHTLDATHADADINTTPTLHDFKSSTLALLYHGLDESSRAASRNIGASNTEEELEDETEGVAVRMVATGRGWQLRTERGKGERRWGAWWRRRGVLREKTSF